MPKLIDPFPELPEGWSAELVSPHHTLINSPTGLMVTIDWERRGYRSGLSTTGPMTNGAKYVGRGWKNRLLANAQRWLATLT